MPEIVVGDATDAGAIRTAMTGCDAVIHAAAVVSMERKAAAPMYRTNTNAAELVLTEAVRQKLDPIINISSAAVFQLDGPSISLSTPLRMADSWYSRSKVEVERFARGMQVAGAPVVSLYPSGVFGPLAPEVTTMHGAAVTWIQNMPIMPSGINIVDVDDVATAVTRAMSPGQGPRSFMLGGHFVAWKELANIIEEMTGVKLKRMVVPGSLLRGLGRFSDATRIRLSRDFPLTTEAMNEATRGSQKYDYASFNEITESVGANLSVSSEAEQMNFGITCLGDDFSQMVEVLADVLRHPTFPEEQVDLVRRRRIVRLQEREQDTASMAHLRFYETIYANHPYGRATSGYLESISTLQRSDLLDYHQRHITPDGAVIVVAGNVNTTKLLQFL